MEEIIKAIDEICNDEVIKAVISNKKNKEFKYNKVTFQLKEKNNKQYYQIEKFTDKQVFHENIEKSELNERILEFMKEEFKQLDSWSMSTTYNVKISKKGKVFLGKKKSNNEKVVNKGHNKEKNYILKEGMLIQPLIDLGVFTKEGKVVNSKYDKYKQINRFIEIIDDRTIKMRVWERGAGETFACGTGACAVAVASVINKLVEREVTVKLLGGD